MSKSLRLTLIALVVVAALVGLPALAVFLGMFQHSVVGPSIERPLSVEEMRALVPKGRYLVFAADCYACHTTRDGPPWAGGLPFETPLGTIYATNISPDKDTGIGAWTRAEFHRAVRDGVGKHGYLYPVMSYTSYRLLTADDVDAMYAYIMSREVTSAALSTIENIEALPFVIVRRKAFPNAFSSGLSVLERCAAGPMVTTSAQPDPTRDEAPHGQVSGRSALPFGRRPFIS
jgi:Cytochrome c